MPFKSSTVKEYPRGFQRVLKFQNSKTTIKSSKEQIGKVAQTLFRLTLDKEFKGANLHEVRFPIRFCLLHGDTEKLEKTLESERAVWRVTNKEKRFRGQLKQSLSKEAGVAKK